MELGRQLRSSIPARHWNGSVQPDFLLVLLGLRIWLRGDLFLCFVQPVAPFVVFFSLFFWSHPVAADWAGALTLLFVCGKETVVDRNETIAQRAFRKVPM